MQQDETKIWSNPYDANNRSIWKEPVLMATLIMVKSPKTRLQWLVQNWDRVKNCSTTIGSLKLSKALS